MKTAKHNGWWLALAMFLAGLPAGWSQERMADAGWNARMTALQEEHDSQTGVAVSIVFDDSGSMNDNHKLVMAKKAFRTWIEHAPDDYRFGLVALNAGLLVPLRRNDRAQILAAVNGLEASGGTPLARTIAQTGKGIYQRRAAGAGYERQVVVILTDVEDTSDRGIKGVQEEIRRLCASGVEVIAFGYQGEGDYMRDSATHFYSPENEQDIAWGLNAIGSEIGDTADVVVDDATKTRMLQATPAPPAQTPPSPRTKPFSPYGTPTPSSTSASPHAQRVNHSSSIKWLALIAVFFVIRSIRRRR